MKQTAPIYAYNKTTGVITLVEVNIDRDQLLLIVNTTRNVTYYNFADSATTLQAFTRGANTSLTLNSAVITASSAHANSDALVIYYDDQESSAKIFNELPYIKVNVNVENTGGDTIVSNVYLRRIGEYSYESIRYQGGEDEAYLKVYLDQGSESSQKAWRLSSHGAYANVQGLVANILPQSGGSSNGDPLPPKTGWTLETGITGTLSISYEQPEIQPISGTVNTYPQQGSTVSNTNFTSATSATLASAVAFREVLTVHNEGPATLFINVGSSVSLTSYQARLFAGDYWEAPAGQQSLQHSGIFSSAGSTARVTAVS